mmetsp:Transcript_36741/g.53820  ORF Transcript_36741/g.53820 Transcript_36741/m.53820 type:complete len:213 (+) Transcript_36741:328-966(+)
MLSKQTYFLKITNDKNLSYDEKIRLLGRYTNRLKRKIHKLLKSNSQKQRTIIERQHTQSMLISVKKQYLQVKQGYEEAKAIGLRYSLELTEARSEAAEAARQSKQLQLQLQSSYSEMNHLEKQQKMELQNRQISDETEEMHDQKELCVEKDCIVKSQRLTSNVDITAAGTYSGEINESDSKKIPRTFLGLPPSYKKTPSSISATSCQQNNDD